MLYQSLNDLFYKNADEYEKEYKARFSAPFTRRLDFKIRQLGWPTEHQLFYCYTEELVSLLLKIVKNNDLLKDVVQKIPPIALIQLNKQSLLEEIRSTNDIEGVRSSRKEIIQALRSQELQDKNVRFYSVANKYIKIADAEKISFLTCGDIRDFYDEFVADEIRSDNPKNLPDGKLFRKEGVSIRTASQKILHEGLVPEEKIIEAMSYALNVLHDESIPALIRVAIFHYLFGYIHPFYDGNGRMARFISSYYLSDELQLIVGLRLSVTIKQQKKFYYDMFEESNSNRNLGDLTPFIMHFLEMVLDTIKNLYKSLEEKSQQLSKCGQALGKLLKSKGLCDAVTREICYILIQAAMFSSDGATAKELQNVIKKSRNTVDDRLLKIPSEWLQKDLSRKPYRYRFNVFALRPYFAEKQ